MNSTESSTISCDVLERFDDAASSAARAQPEYVQVPGPTAPAAGRWGSPRSRFSPPSEKEAKAAKKFWREALRRFTEPVPGKKGRLRMIESERARITIEFGNAAFGSEVDVADKGCLVLLHHSRPFQGEKGLVVEESAILIPWTEILNVRLTVYRPVEQANPHDSVA